MNLWGNCFAKPLNCYKNEAKLNTIFIPHHMSSIVQIKVKKAGWQDTYQDIGRFGFRKLGVPASGAVDVLAHQWANWLVGNPLDFPTLEMTLKGGIYTFLNPAIIAITGADFSPTLNNQPIPNYQTIEVKKGDVLHFDYAKKGCRAYFSIQGKVRLNVTLGSYSTYLDGQFGGFEGRFLKKNDLITIEKTSKNKAFLKSIRVVPEHFQLKYTSPIIVRIIIGMEYNWLSETSKTALFQQYFEISNKSNRMGIRLKNKPLIQQKNQEMTSSGTNIGTMQLLPTGQVIILLNDGQVTGGYPRIGQVIQADLPRLAQLLPKGKIKFKAIDRQEAVNVWRYQVEKMKHFMEKEH